MRKRKRLPLRWVKKLLKRQGGVCAVGKCAVVLVLGPRGQHTNFIDEHRVPLALGGTNALKNRELRCIAHARSKTYGPRGKHTTLDSDIHSIAKVRRIRKGKMAVACTKRRTKYARNYAWPKGRKIKSRPFPKKERRS